MSFRYWYKNDDGDLVEFTDRVQVGWADNPGTAGLVMNAEEGSVGNCTLRVEDPGGDWEFPRGHRKVYVVETDADYDDFGGVCYSGYTWVRNFRRDIMRDGAARIIDMDLVDINTVFERRIMVGSDCKRPAETDVERLDWLMSTTEASLIDDFTYFSSAGPVDMDAVDYRGQSFRQVVEDCALQSGKNWYLWPSLGGYSFWYGPRGTSDFSSAIRISNVLTDLDDYEDTFAPAIDSTLKRDPSRVYSGIYRAYSQSYLYTQNEDTATDFARRDTYASSPNIKTKTKALIRNERELSDISTEEDIISTAIIVPRIQTNAVYQGQRVQVRFSHFPGYEDFVWVRVLNRTVREVGPDQVELAMELSPEEPVDVPSHDVFGILARATAYDFLPYVYFDWVGDYPDTGGGVQPTIGPISPIYEPDNPMAPTWVYSGWLIEGDGWIDATFYTSTIGITPTSVTFAITLNGVPVASVTQYNADTGNGNDARVSVEHLDVANGDILRATVVADPQGVPFFRAPRGTGDNAEALTITDGFLV